MFNARSLLFLSFVQIKNSCCTGENLIKNGDFELPVLGTTGFQTYKTNGASVSDKLTDWTISGAGIDHIKQYWNAYSGSQSLDMSALAAGSISQTVDGLCVG